MLGRTDDVINTGGVKVSAARVADVLLDHDRVRQALVLPVAHSEWGQVVAAVVAVRRPLHSGSVPDDHHPDGGFEGDLDPASNESWPSRCANDWEPPPCPNAGAGWTASPSRHG